VRILIDQTRIDDRSYYEDLDSEDEFAAFRDRYVTVPGEIYLDGNSLGLPPKSTLTHLDSNVRDGWGSRGIRAWMECDWINLPFKLGDTVAPLIGASAGEIVFADSTSVNLFKVVSAAVQLNDSRKVILTENGNFPTDEYVLQGISEFRDDLEVRAVSRDNIAEALKDDVSVLVLTHVHYKTGEIFDMEHLTKTAHKQGSLVVWDLSHSAGAIPVALNDCGVDFAVGCGYKYLCGGPGAPAFIYVRQEIQSKALPAIAAWMGHKAPFAFDSLYEPAEGIARFQSGTPPALGLIALQNGVEMFRNLKIEALANKSRLLGDLFIERLLAAPKMAKIHLGCPRDSKSRGCQVSFEHENSYAIVRALIKRGIVGDFRAPYTMRFGLPALYTRFVDVFDATTAILDVINTREWDSPEFTKQVAVT